MFEREGVFTLEVVNNDFGFNARNNWTDDETDDIGTNILMSQCADHRMTLPDAHNKIPLDSRIDGWNTIV